MDTLRDQYHDLGNQINLAVQVLEYMKTLTGDLKVSDEDKGKMVEIFQAFEKTESILMTLDRDIVELKNLSYRFMDPDKSLAESREEIKKENTGIKILVVDDLEDICDLTKKAFERRGYQVESAKNFEEASQKIKDLQPDAVLLDLYLAHGMEGLDILKLIKKDFSAIKCIVVTREDDEWRLKVVKDLGADEILMKPVRTAQLEAKISGLLSSRRK